MRFIHSLNSVDKIKLKILILKKKNSQISKLNKDTILPMVEIEIGKFI